MKVIHLSIHDISGGAARAAYRLHQGLRQLGHESLMLVASRYSNDPTVSIVRLPPSEPGRIWFFLRGLRIRWAFERYRDTRPEGYDVFSDNRSKYSSLVAKQLPICDVVNLHWVAGFVDYREFFSNISERVPMIWTLHDMNPFTGGCHYDQGCGQFHQSCGTCPQLGSDDIGDLSNQIWRRKESVFDKIPPDRLHIVTPSRWLSEAAAHSTLLKRFQISVIPNGVDVDQFAPRDRFVARQALEIPHESQVILFAAQNIIDRRKGFVSLVEALGGLENSNNIFLLSLGKMQSSLNLEIPYLHLGHIENDRLLSMVYSAADILVIPSLQDNLPNTILEAMACGTPVVGFNIGGIPDVVRPGVTGSLVEVGNINDFRNSIKRSLNDADGLQKMSENCRSVIVEEYSLEVQAQKYTELYHKMLNGMEVA